MLFENHLDEMVDIVKHFHENYVPMVTLTRDVVVPGCEHPKHLTDHKFHHILLGGDQVMVVCAAKSKHAKELYYTCRQITGRCSRM